MYVSYCNIIIIIIIFYIKVFKQICFIINAYDLYLNVNTEVSIIIYTKKKNSYNNWYLNVSIPNIT